MSENEECSKLTCNWNEMEIVFSSDLFAIEDTEKAVFTNGMKPVFKDNKWRLNCPLGKGFQKIHN